MKRNYYLVFLVFLTFFIISIITNILGAINPPVAESYNLNDFMRGFLPMALFLAYGVMAIPGGMLVEVHKEKKTMIGAFILVLAGVVFFVMIPKFSVFLGTLFIVGAGFAMLQVVIYPLLRVAGGEEHFAFNAVMAQLVFGGASYAGPHIYKYFVLNLDSSAEKPDFIIRGMSRLVPEGISWLSMYWFFLIITLLMILLLFASRFPRVERTDEEQIGAWSVIMQLFKKRIVNLYFIGIFCYVGTEQGVSYWISTFLERYHGFDPNTVGANAVAWFWGMMIFGCVLGLVLLKLFDSKKILLGSVILSLICLIVALFGPGEIAKWAFPAIGFTISVLYSIIYSLALNSMEEHHGSFSGILITGIVGGAVVPFIIGWLSQLFELRFAMLFLLITFGYMLSVGIWARPIISNKTISLKRKKG
ncbi:MAG: MFS transporter [Bacteroides sp. SM23_62_1]|nr:MAG: MFS transporter [Bacteroides sp. SM23_62_1]